MAHLQRSAGRAAGRGLLAHRAAPDSSSKPLRDSERNISSGEPATGSAYDTRNSPANRADASWHGEKKRSSCGVLTGMSGTGKSSVLAELTRRGHRVVDTDGSGWIVEIQTPDGPVPIWDRDRIEVLLAAHRTGTLFIGGCVANQGTFYDRFDAVVLLSAPVEVVARVADRTNPFGSTPADRAKIVTDMATYEQLLRASCCIPGRW